MHYLTRHLEAMAEFSHGSVLLRPGEVFSATDADAEYLIARHRAKDAGGNSARMIAALPIPAPTVAPRRGPGRPPKILVPEGGPAAFGNVVSPVSTRDVPTAISQPPTAASLPFPRLGDRGDE